MSDFLRIRVEVPDIHGTLRGKVVPAKKLEKRGLGFCNAFFGLTVFDDFFDNSWTGPANGYEDFFVEPDLSTLRPVSWLPDTGAILCDLKTKEWEPHPLCGREAVRRAEARLAALGYEARVGLEFEFFVFRLEGDAAARRSYGELLPVSRLRQAYSLQRWPEMSAFIEDVYSSLGELDIQLDAIHTELGYGVLEAALAPASPLEAADQAARFKLACKEVAAHHGLVTTFMAKWKTDEPGSSGHVHQSLLDSNGRPAFWAGRESLSDPGRAYLEGVLRATGELSAIYGPFFNSYRRPGPQYWAPERSDWGYDNRLVCCRIVADAPESTRIEQRRPGADLAIYLSVAGCLSSGARGIERSLELRPEALRGSRGTDVPLDLPRTLHEATDRLRSSELARDLLGTALVDYYIETREEELRITEIELARVGSWELERYFETV